jgi:ABC-type glycerol-3-phosphate transport system substrate-binding protein
MAKQQSMSRRQFLKRLLVGGGAVAAPALLAACGSTAPTTADNATSAPVSNATTAPAATTAPVAATTAPVEATTAPAASTGSKAEVVHWDWLVSQGPALEEAIKAFEAENPDITIARTVNNVDNNNYANLFQLAVKGDTMPDVFMMPQGTTLQEQIEAGWLADLTQFQGFEDWKGTFPTPELNFLEGTNTIGGKTYSAPFSANDDAMWIQMWVNTKVFKDAGIVDESGNAKLPETADDVLQYARTIKEKSGGQAYGYAFAAKSNVYHWATYMAQLSGAPGGESGIDYRTGEYTLGKNEAYKQVIDLVNTLRDEELILPDSGSIDDEALRVLFAQGKFGMYLNGSWIVNSFKQAAPDFKDYDVTHVPYFGTTEPKSFFYTGPGGQSFAISAKSKNPEAAWKWFQYLYSAPVGELWVKGGNGRSIFPEANKAEYFENPALRKLAELGPQFSRVGPSPSLRNPDFGKVKMPEVKPGIQDIMQGIYTGQIEDPQAALQDLADRQTKAREQGIADAKAAGANVSIEDWIFPDWDPTKDYATKKA